MASYKQAGMSILQDFLPNVTGRVMMKNFLICVMVLVGITLCILGYGLKSATVEVLKPGNQTTAALTGAGMGAGAGFGIGYLIGGIGIAACGTGVGIPAGAVCLGLAVLLSSAGAGIGYLSGRPDVTVSSLIYPTWMWVICVGLGVFMFVCGFICALSQSQEK